MGAEVEWGWGGSRGRSSCIARGPLKADVAASTYTNIILFVKEYYFEGMKNIFSVISHGHTFESEFFC